MKAPAGSAGRSCPPSPSLQVVDEKLCNTDSGKGGEECNGDRKLRDLTLFCLCCPWKSLPMWLFSTKPTSPGLQHCLLAWGASAIALCSWPLPLWCRLAPASAYLPHKILGMGVITGSLFTCNKKNNLKSEVKGKTDFQGHNTERKSRVEETGPKMQLQPCLVWNCKKPKQIPNHPKLWNDFDQS